MIQAKRSKKTKPTEQILNPAVLYVASRAHCGGRLVRISSSSPDGAALASALTGSALSLSLRLAVC